MTGATRPSLLSVSTTGSVFTPGEIVYIDYEVANADSVLFNFRSAAGLSFQFTDQVDGNPATVVLPDDITNGLWQLYYVNLSKGSTYATYIAGGQLFTGDGATSASEVGTHAIDMSAAAFTLNGATPDLDPPVLLNVTFGGGSFAPGDTITVEYSSNDGSLVKFAGFRFISETGQFFDIAEYAASGSDVTGMATAEIPDGTENGTWQLYQVYLLDDSRFGNSSTYSSDGNLETSSPLSSDTATHLVDLSSISFTVDSSLAAMMFTGDPLPLLLTGGAGLDTVDYGASPSGVLVNLETGVGRRSHAAGDRYISIEAVLGSAHADVLWGDDGDNRLQGNGGNDFLRAGAGLDTLLGGDGDDKLVAGPGADILDGGAGADQVRYDRSEAGVTLDLGAGTASGGWAEGDTLLSIEEARGSVHDDVLRGSSAGNVLLGLAGDDVIEGVAGVNYLYGNAGQDRLIAGTGDDRMKGGADFDTFVFGSNHGFNYIKGFERTLDRIEIDDGTPGTAVFADLTITKLSWGTRIDYQDTTIALTSVTGAITDAIFDFV